jgi:hypothetical protein
MSLRLSLPNAPQMMLDNTRRWIDSSVLDQLIQRNCAMRILTLIAFCLLFVPGVSAHEYCSKAECEETRQKIRKIQSKMRQGYTRKQGEKMEADLRMLTAIRSKKCR